MRIRSAPLLLLFALVLGLGLGSPQANAESELPVDFAQEIRPILSDKCFLCHGPDATSREADLRLDQRAAAIADLGGYAAIVAGDSQASELVKRIFSNDESLIMPPPDSEKSLTATERDLLRRWIKQGAPYSAHWAFMAPRRPQLPEISLKWQAWPRTPIDRFILARLEEHSLAPSPAASKSTLLRRLHLDLIGLPPSISQIGQFLANDSDNPSNFDVGYEQLIERLLASPHYGERWGRHWLDAARYADSDGYEKDMQRTAWPYRDWIINAFNQDMPYDEFIIEQIAGDLLPAATPEQIIATGFLRNSMVNEEGGADPEQFRVEGVFDRMDAIGKSILGITTQCAQCHTHKYDPLTQADYYGMFAFLNSCHESYQIAYRSEQQARANQIDRRVARLEAQLRRRTPDWPTQVSAWAESERGTQPEWIVLKPEVEPFGGTKYRLLEDSSILSEGFAPTKASASFNAETEATAITGVRLELLTHPQLPGAGPGRSIDGTAALTEFELLIAPADGSAPQQQVKFVRVSADVNPEEQPLSWPYLIPDQEDGDQRRTGGADFAIDDDAQTAWTTDSGPATRHQPRKIVFTAEVPFGYTAGTQLELRLNQKHGGDNADARENYLIGRFRFSLTTAPSPSADPLPADVRALIEAKPPAQWSERERDVAFSYWRTTVPKWASVNQEIRALLAQYPDGDFQLVTREQLQPRATHLLQRGNFLDLGERIEPHTPKFLHAFPNNAPVNRLGFAQWLVDRQSPTTARTIVNRVWQAYFGTGLVETPEDLGMQSPPPSHPALLDWLAVEFMESGWSFKHLHRLIVNSATYRQSSRFRPRLTEQDPRNRLLARGPRVRVEAEIVRDIALSASGLLDVAIGGPSVYPPAPSFLFEPPASYGPKNWFTEVGAQRYRRSMYVQAYRSVPFPPLQTFDAPKGDAACVRRVRSNTPLQALTMLNETQFMDCSRALAQRVQREIRTSDSARLRRAFRLCVAREPADDELDLLQSLLDKSRAHYETQKQQAAAVAANDSAASNETSVAENAAWTIVCRAILNLDETITKQ